MQGNIKLLDCTIRDGGRGLEDLNKLGIKTGFTVENRSAIATHLRNAKIDVIELGSIGGSDKGLEKYAIFQNIELLSREIPSWRDKNQMFVCFYIGPDTDSDSIPEYHPGLCDGVRVCLRYSELQKSLDYCAMLSKKGYKVFIQPMVTMRYTEDELKRVIHTANEIGAYALYFVDSYGYMDERDIENFFRLYNERLDSNIHIGFHAHNNMARAFANAKFFLQYHNYRNVILDSCVTGMGQGAGNLQTEVIAHFLNAYFDKKYDFENILEVCDILESFPMREPGSWGYSPVGLLPAIHRTAYKYAYTLKVANHMKLAEINRLLSDMPDEMRHRFSKDNLSKLLERNIQL